VEKKELAWDSDEEWRRRPAIKGEVSRDWGLSGNLVEGVRWKLMESMTRSKKSRVLGRLAHRATGARIEKRGVILLPGTAFSEAVIREFRKTSGGRHCEK